jgi:hypothetical protein
VTSRRVEGSRNAVRVAAARLSRMLGDAGVLVGGLAVSAHGHVRGTDDVDFVSKLDPREIRRRLTRLGIESRIVRLDDDDGGPPWTISGTIGGVPFDILPPLVPVYWTRTIPARLPDGVIVRVVDLEGLLRLKIRAGGHKDLWDVAALLRLHPSYLEVALRSAEAYGCRDELQRWLHDRRQPGKPRDARR